MPGMTYVLMNSEWKPLEWYEALIVAIVFVVIFCLAFYFSERWFEK